MQWGQKLEQKNGQAQDIEFVVESGQLYLLQSRKVRLTTQGLLFSLLDRVSTGTISRKTALKALNIEALEDLDQPSFLRTDIDRAESEGKQLCQGLGVYHGAAVGRVAFSLEVIQRLRRVDVAVLCILIKE